MLAVLFIFLQAGNKFLDIINIVNICKVSISICTIYNNLFRCSRLDVHPFRMGMKGHCCVAVSPKPKQWKRSFIDSRMAENQTLEPWRDRESPRPILKTSEDGPRKYTFESCCGFRNDFGWRLGVRGCIHPTSRRI